mmetsp:Transcript_8012/g.15082  ORF Transcript_8012/g.15082 Transcript_8012/m.15082 type:complete len:504 (+) Transcript_8012:129-1640(+)|eukprot:CAMPEP_0176498128 /NCGR_PEP_ID=MMETSP0200_2-20121128/12134_1 /TAXON_ID=947934 /ORGANISM="Chaetoceros sp., Strain GSL56" /LENGTH=503 /DNA_ID=CAMNT_0017896271 /DNA_START=68 /DNA_END=1579 /DNA_ORIENTATION=+
MDDTGNDEAVSQFLSITGSADAAQAKSYLEMSGNDLQTAISLFLEHQTSGNGVVESSYDDSFGRTSVATGGSGQNQVRAPDQTRRMRLLDFDDDGAAAALSMGAGLMNHDPFGPGAGMLGLGGGNLPRMSAFAEDDNMDFDHELHGSFRDVINRAVNLQGEYHNGRNSPEETFSMSSRVTRLSDMFAPPLHLIHSAGGFQGARNVAKDSKRWLLVNVQSDSDFACHALNRDVWRDELCENLVREGFIFWQSDDTTDDGRTYCQRYNVTSFPHIGIVDPRTGRLMFRKEGWTQENPLTPEAFAELAADFCSRHSFYKAPVAPKSGATNPKRTAVVDIRDVIEMTEEQQLQAAIRASMNHNAQDNDDSSIEYVMEDNEDDEFVEDNTQQVDSSIQGVSSPPKEEKRPTFIDEIIALQVGEEPSENSARVMIRMPDGKRLVRRFKLDHTVKVIYAYVAQSNDDAKSGKEFVMKAGFPPKDLIHSVDESISSSGLAGDSITVRWKDE